MPLSSLFKSPPLNIKEIGCFKKVVHLNYSLDVRIASTDIALLQLSQKGVNSLSRITSYFYFPNMKASILVALFMNL